MRAEEEEREKSRIATECLARYRKICPSAFRETEQTLIPDQNALNKVLKWEFGARGLLIFGDTGLGKTRSVWLLIRRLMSGGLDVEAMTASRFSREISTSWDVSGGFARLINRLVDVPLLFIDDLGKEAMTTRVEAELFAVVNERTAGGLPIIITTNYGSKSLIGNFSSSETAMPLIRRLKEFTTGIHFKNKG